MARSKDTAAGATKSAPRRSTLREEQKIFTRERLLEGAVQAFERHGFDAATVDEIAAAAGASRATFYLHFSSKVEVAQALMEQARPDVEAYYSELDRVLAEGTREDFREWLRDALQWFADHQALVVALEHILLTGREVGRDVVAPFTDYMPRFLDRWSDRRVEAKLRVWLLVQTINRLNLGWHHGGQMADADEDLVLDVLTDLWASGLGMDRSARRRSPGGGQTRRSRR